MLNAQCSMPNAQWIMKAARSSLGLEHWALSIEHC